MGFDVGKYTRSKWLKGADLEPGRQVLVTVKRAYEHTFEQQDNEVKAVLDFKELDQSLILNKTQIIAMATAFGGDPDQWVGKRVMMMPVPSSFAGKPTIMLQAAVAPKKVAAPVFAGREYGDAEAPGDPDWDTPEPF